METGELTPLATTEPVQDITPAENTEYKPTAEDWADYGLWAAERQQRQMEEYPRNRRITEWPNLPESLNNRRLWSLHRPFPQGSSGVPS